MLRHRTQILQHLDWDVIHAWTRYIGKEHLSELWCGNIISGVFLWDHPRHRPVNGILPDSDFLPPRMGSIYHAFACHAVADDPTLDHMSRMLKRLTYSLTALVWNRAFQVSSSSMAIRFFTTWDSFHCELYHSTFGHFLPFWITLSAVMQLGIARNDVAYRLVSALICSLSFPVESILPEAGESTAQVSQLHQLIHFYEDTTVFAAFVRDKRHPEQEIYKARTVTWNNSESKALLDPIAILDEYLEGQGHTRGSIHGPILLQDGTPLTRSRYNLWLERHLDELASELPSSKCCDTSDIPIPPICAGKLLRSCRLSLRRLIRHRERLQFNRENLEFGFYCGFSPAEIQYARTTNSLRALSVTPIT